MAAHASPRQQHARLATLVYELLDAHEDTARLARDLEWEPAWREHLDYLRQLQRVGREALAHAAYEERS